VPSLTESVVELGRGDRLVGVTRYCADVAPPGVAVVGGTKDVDVEAVAALAPDLVVANDEENRAADLDRLRAAGLGVHSTFPRRVVDVAPMLRGLGQVLGAQAAGERLADEVEAAIAEAAAPADGRRALVLVWRRPWMAAARGTYAADLLAACGLEVSLDRGDDRYPRLAPGDPALDGLDVVVLPDEPYAFGADDLPAVRALVGDGPRLELVDGRLLTWHGRRTADALRRLAHLPTAGRPA